MPTLSNTITVLLAEDVDLNASRLLLSSFSSSSSVYSEFGNRACKNSNFEVYLTTFMGRGNIGFGSNCGLRIGV